MQIDGQCMPTANINNVLLRCSCANVCAKAPRRLLRRCANAWLHDGPCRDGCAVCACANVALQMRAATTSANACGQSGLCLRAKARQRPKRRLPLRAVCGGGQSGGYACKSAWQRPTPCPRRRQPKRRLRSLRPKRRLRLRLQPAVVLRGVTPRVQPHPDRPAHAVGVAPSEQHVDVVEHLRSPEMTTTTAKNQILPKNDLAPIRP